jgi:hypothetical protein
MNNVRHLLLIVGTIGSAVLVSVSASGQMPADRFRLTVGLGYDHITQGYYLSQIDTLAVDEDSLTYLKQTSDALNDIRLKTRLEWSAPGLTTGYFKFDNLTYLSNEDLRNSLVLSFRSGPLTLENDFHARGVWDEGKTSQKGYLTNTIGGRFKPEISDGFFFVLRNSFELVRYDGSSEYEYYFDYNYNKLSIGFEKQFGWTDQIALIYRNDMRVVSDSTRLNYTRHRALFELNWSPTFDISLELENELMRIESDKENDLDDGWEELIEGRATLHLGDKWKAGLRNLFEYVAYDSQDVVNFDYTYNTTELLISRNLSTYSEIFVKPSALLFSSKYTEFEQQDYEQYAVEYGFDISRGDWLWLSVSHKIGHRDYRHEADEFYTDYLLNQLNLLGNLKIFANVRLNTILSIDWEDHEQDGDDNNLSLFSIGVDYRFR